MKRFKIAMLMAALALGLTANAQYVTSHAKISMPGQQNGLYYALPRTVVQLDFIIEEIELVKGPYSQFAYLVGADDYVTEDGVEYRLAEVRMGTYAEADPNATFFVAFNGRRGNETTFSLTPQGILQGIGTEPAPMMEQPALPAPTTPIPSVDRTFRYQYGSNGLRSTEQLANSAAEMVNRIREEKIKLITGFQETAFTLDTYRQMLADLDAMENEYLSLFLGKRIVTTTVRTVCITPSKEVPTQTIGKFSTATGFTTDLTQNGTVITLQALSLNTTGNINEPSQSAVETISHENKLFYRIPETANVKVSLGNEVLLEQRATIAQYGVFMLAPLDKTKLALDPTTGQVIGVTME